MLAAKELYSEKITVGGGTFEFTVDVWTFEWGDVRGERFDATENIFLFCIITQMRSLFCFLRVW